MEVISLQALLAKLVDPPPTFSRIRKLEQMKNNVVNLPDYRLTFNQADGLNALITLLDDKHPPIVNKSLEIITEYCKHSVEFTEVKGLRRICQILKRSDGEDLARVRLHCIEAICSLAENIEIANELVNRHHVSETLGRFLDADGMDREILLKTLKAFHHLACSRFLVEMLSDSGTIQKLWGLFLRNNEPEVMKELLVTLEQIFKHIMSPTIDIVNQTPLRDIDWSGFEGRGATIGKLVQIFNGELKVTPEIEELCCRLFLYFIYIANDRFATNIPQLAENGFAAIPIAYLKSYRPLSVPIQELIPASLRSDVYWHRHLPSPIDKDNISVSWPKSLKPPDQALEYTFALLQKLLYLPKPPTQLFQPQILEVYRYLTREPNPSFQAVKFLFSLASSNNFGVFMALVKIGFPVLVGKELQTHHGCERDQEVVKECCQLDTVLRLVGRHLIDLMAEFAERCGRGEMFAPRHAADIKAIALSSPLILSAKRLPELEYKYHILNIIFDVLKHGKDEERMSALVSLTAFASVCANIRCLSGPIQNECLATHLAGDVQFQLGEELVRANGTFLRERSPYFAALLRPRFIKPDNLISISAVQSDIFKGVLHIIYGCGTKCTHLNNLPEKSAGALLNALDQFGMVENVDLFARLIPLYTDWETDFSEFLSSCQHMHKNVIMLPFLASWMGPAVRLRVVDALLRRNESDVEEFISIWKALLLGGQNQK